MRTVRVWHMIRSCCCDYLACCTSASWPAKNLQQCGSDSTMSFVQTSNLCFSNLQHGQQRTITNDTIKGAVFSLVLQEVKHESRIQSFWARFNVLCKSKNFKKKKDILDLFRECRFFFCWVTFTCTHSLEHLYFNLIEHIFLSIYIRNSYQYSL